MNSNASDSLNLVQQFAIRAQKYGARRALLYKSLGQFQEISWQDWAAQVRLCALGLSKIGVQKGDTVAILSENRPEWTVADLSVLSLGAIVVPIYPTSSQGDIAHIFQNAGIKWVFVSSNELFVKINESVTEGRILRTFLLSGSPAHKDRVMSFADLLSAGKQVDKKSPALYEQFVSSVLPLDVATIIYTSGTTGPPKGVMLSHDNFYQNYLGAREKISVDESDIALSFLPLSHVFERLAGYYFMVFSGATIAYAENMQSVPEDMLRIRPTVMAAVPRFYEKIYARILEKISQSSPFKKRVFEWARKVAGKATAYRIQSKSMSWIIWFEYMIAKKLVLSKIRASLGGKLRFFISGGAPLNPSLAEFFYSADVLILEGYGLTETSPVIAVNAEKGFRFGTVGQCLSNCHVKIADDGEILTAGPCVMKGYFNDSIATQEVIRDGWFHTGDLGKFDRDGYLTITGRKKDIIVNSGGKKIAPQNIEREILSDALFSQVVVLGDKRPFVTALIVPNKESVMSYAKQHGFDHLSWDEIVQHEKVYRLAADHLKPVMLPRASFEQVKYFALLANELTTASGELTPTLKVKRPVIYERYQKMIEKMYDEQPRLQSVF